MMYYNFDLQHKQQKEIFMNYKNFNIKEFLYQTQSNVFIKLIKTFEINLNLFRASVMILCESVYNQKVNDQILKRTHRPNQKHIVIYKIFCNNIIIEKLMKSIRRNKSVFEKEFFF